MTICIIDTSVFCELLRVPTMDGHHRELLAEAKAKEKAGETLLLPMATIFETGNHIGDYGNGQQRRETAGRYVEQVSLALEGISPFTPTPFFEPDELRQWLADFPDWAMRTNGDRRGGNLPDLTIVKEFDRQCRLNPGHRVYIWSQHGRLSTYERPQP